MKPPEVCVAGEDGAPERPSLPTSSTNLTMGAVVHWEAPTAEALANSFPGIRVKSLCGVGGMGAVYRAEQVRLGRDVAVKILPAVATPDAAARERFEREARILSGLNHPHILHLHDFGALPDSTLYLVMEWAGGGDLAHLLDGKPQPLDKVLAMVKQIAAALEAAHARGVIHRDLKPANVLVLEDGRLTLADFGLAHASGAAAVTLTHTGTIFGTFDYMAPEQLESAANVTSAVDLYAFGVMTYLMVTGRLPRGAYARPSRITGAPEAVDVFLNSAMATDPRKRPANAEAFAREFEFACHAPARLRQRQLIVLGVALVTLALVWARGAIINSERAAFMSEKEEAARVAEQQADQLAAMREAQREERRMAREAALKAAAEMAVAQARAKAEAAVEAARVAEQARLAGAAVAVESPPVVVAEAEPVVKVEPEPASAAELKAELPQVPWIWVLPEVVTAENALSGDWRMTRGELVSGDERCVLALPVRLAINYDVAVEFTRMSGKNSVAVFLPTISGTGTFEVDAWDLGIAGMQMIDGEDMRRTGRYFPARIENGVTNRLILEVRGAKVAATWNGESQMSWDLTKNRVRVPPLWQVKPDAGLCVGSWSSPTTFHRIAYRAYPIATTATP
jgi:hypothetical protein